MHLSRMIISLFVQSVVGGAAGGSTPSAVGMEGALEKTDCVPGTPELFEDSIIDELYEHCRGMPFLDFLTQEVCRMNPISETEAKTDAILLAWLGAGNEPRTLWLCFAKFRFSFLIMLRTIFATENVERVYESISPMCWLDPQRHYRAKSLSKRNAGVLLAAVNAAISTYLDSADPCELFKTRRSMEKPYDLFLHLYMRSRHREEPLEHGFGALLGHLLCDRDNAHDFKRYALPFIQVLSKQKLVTADAYTDLERVVLQVAATVRHPYVIDIFREVQFRTPHIDLFKEYVLDKPGQNANSAFVQEYLFLCIGEKLISISERAALLDRYYKSRNFFLKGCGKGHVSRMKFHKRKPAVICSWIFKRFVVDQTYTPEHRSYLQSVVDGMHFNMLTDILSCAFQGEFKAHISSFLGLLSHKYLEEFDTFLGSLSVGSRYNQEFYFELKLRICNIIQPELAPLNFPCELASPSAKKRRLEP
ncbi:hypothetical protein PAPHI01_1886 [Pancytospora philotis]|nr:hypothetical protein PAPHI01_1886 [Pancytospora philotis]